MPIVDRWHSKDRATGKKVRTSRYGKGKRWSAQWTDAQGRRGSKAFATQDEAKANLAAIEASIYRGSYIDPEAGRVSFRTVAEEWLASAEQEPLTREANRHRLEKHVYPYLGDAPLGSIGPSDIRTWLRGLAETPTPENVGASLSKKRALSGTTRRALYRLVSAVFAYALADDLIARNPCKAKSVHVPKYDTKRATPWTTERARAVYAELPERWKITLLMGLLGGLRRGEIMGFDPYQDIDWEAGELIIQRQVLQHPSSKLSYSLPKYRKIRRVPFPPELGEAIKAHMSKFPPVAVTLPWKVLDGEPVTARLLVYSREKKAGNAVYLSSHVWRPACQRAGFEPTNRDGYHVLRHTYASSLIDGGESIVVVAARLGHADAAITLKTYAHLMPQTADRTRQIASGIGAAVMSS